MYILNDKKFINGTSSLLLIFGAIKALLTSKLILWKISCILLVPASYLCNSNNYKPFYLLMDYATISFICCSYLNHATINGFFISAFIYEYERDNTIEKTKNVLFLFTIMKTHYKTYVCIGPGHFYFLFGNTIIGFFIYATRYEKIINNDMKDVLALTYLFHICIMNVVYICSITAV
jgi:hypothetical protein